MNTTINEQHLSKTAYVYVRQSTLAQVRHHQESTERQYALRQKALELGWIKTSERTVLFNCASGLKYPLPPVTRSLDRHAPIDFDQL